MEEMSKKTKRLEKENLALSRKHDQTSHNIIQMTEERIRTNKEIEDLRQRNTRLENISRAMQAQGRKLPEGIAGIDEDDEGTESDYEDDEDYADEEEEGGVVEDEVSELVEGGPLMQEDRGGGPGPPPPQPPASQQPNGMHLGGHGTRVNGEVVNGVGTAVHA